MILMFTCLIRYVVDFEKLEDFEKYATVWMRLIQRYGGVHHWYFLPSKDIFYVPSSSSFSDLGACGPDNIAVALFSFENLEKYETYKRKVKDDEKYKYITDRVERNPCFVSYERTFHQPHFPDNTSLSQTSDL